VNRIAPHWPVFVVGLVPLTFPLQQLWVGHLPVPLVLLAIVVAVGVVTAHQLARRRPVLARSPLLLALGLVLTSALLSTLVSADPIASIRLDGDYLLGLGLVGAIAVVVRTAAAARVLIGILCLVGAGVCTQGLLTAAPPEAHYGGSLVENRASGVFVQPNELGAYAALIVVLSLALLFSAGRRDPVRLLAVASLAASLGALVITLSRGAWLGLVLGLAVLLLLAPSIRRRFLAAIGLLAGLTIGAAFVPVRKPGKLPAATNRETYDLEYGTDTLEIHADACTADARVLIVDDVLATGGTADATRRLVESLGAHVEGFSFLIALSFLPGRQRLGARRVESLLTF